MGLFDYEKSDHDRFSKGSTTYRRMLAKEYTANQERREKEEMLRKRAEYAKANKAQELGVEGFEGAPGTGIYAEGVSPMQRFLSERAHGRRGSQLEGMSKLGMDSGSGLESAMLRKGSAENPRIAYDKYYLGLSDEDREKVNLSKRADKVIDVGTGYTNQRGENIVNKNLKLTGQRKSEGLDIANRLTTHGESMGIMDNMYDTVSYSMDRVDELAQNTGKTTTGLGGLLAKIPGTNAKFWRGQRDTIVARLGLEQLAKMKALSKTGASGLGQLSEKELKVLQDQLANLDQLQDGEHIKRGLKNIYSQMAKFRDAVREDQKTNIDWYNKNSGDLKKSNVFDNTRYLGRIKEHKSRVALPESLGGNPGSKDFDREAFNARRAARNKGK
ncbi:MAG: hypothetical protein DRP85_03260 [Candidatus Makaraimicrobium thalassicum]|nr:MAG: hypothetical protein DRP85_03260 [Candidatus Omnitrophota bacterium]